MSNIVLMFLSFDSKLPNNSNFYVSLNIISITSGVISSIRTTPKRSMGFEPMFPEVRPTGFEPVVEDKSSPG
jgi:hypothetical protein